MEVFALSQSVISDLSSLENLSSDDLSKVCKYFLQVIVKGSSTIELG
jgi:hypothetical protein